MLVQHWFANAAQTHKSSECDLSKRVAVVCCSEFRSDLANIKRQFLIEFPPQRLYRRFVLLDLPARKLP